MKIPLAVRNAVLADVAAGMTHREAGEKHGVKTATVGQWCKRARIRKSEATKAKDRKKGLKPGKVPAVPGLEEGVSKPAPPPKPRARPGPPKRTVTEDLGEEFRGYLRKTARRLGRILAGEDDFVDPRTGKAWAPSCRDLADAARALDTILLRTPDILSFDEKTGGRAKDGTVTDEERERMDRLMLAAEDEPPALQVVGGRESTG